MRGGLHVYVINSGAKKIHLRVPAEVCQVLLPRQGFGSLGSPFIHWTWGSGYVLAASPLPLPLPHFHQYQHWPVTVALAGTEYGVRLKSARSQFLVT